MMNIRVSICCMLMGFLCAPVFCAAEGQEAGKETLSVIFSRKSVRQYLDKPVARQDLDTLMRAGMAAPTAADTRPWAFIAITDRKTLDALADAVEWGKMLKRAPAAIVVCGDPSKALTGVESAYWINDCSCASENILLAAEAKGLGAVWVGVHPIKERIEKVQRILRIPDHIIPLNIIPVGWPTGVEKPKDKYDEKDVHWEKW